MYTTTEAMRILKVTGKTLRNYIKSGMLKAYKLGNPYNPYAPWRIYESDLESFIKKNTNSTVRDRDKGVIINVKHQK